MLARTLLFHMLPLLLLKMYTRQLHSLLSHLARDLIVKDFGLSRLRLQRVEIESLLNPLGCSPAIDH
jgi:hypothetical protein